ncbi:brefeldin A-inhibited guanine nucleotide-exchange protein 3 isoform X1 [Corythoichthys intestinalis]|uniref:brefeldin A-inhibited guanine nucleotide-exchange protein 3 isoform X1 n=1 Tax=Corythoichthys intestinalis TaxID=161448 RepID=UPI0025A4DCC3|nr:brefeldin A-inhibited guanine nucleotide-exchange protein 3 isoform X1 [Corythoichthys intestinalis]
MEDILRTIQQDAAGHKRKSLRDACALACESLESWNASGRLSPADLRARCLLPLQMALESKNLKLGQTALIGMQKLLCEDRLLGGAGEEAEPTERRLLSQILAALRTTPELHEDLQVEVMKVLLCVTYSPNFDVNADSVLRIAQVCTETYARGGHRRSVDTAVRATLSQILGDLTLQLRHRQEAADGEEMTAPPLERRGTVCPLTLKCVARQPGAVRRRRDGPDALLRQAGVAGSRRSDAATSLPGEHLGHAELLPSHNAPVRMLHRPGLEHVLTPDRKRLCPALVAVTGDPLKDKCAAEWERLHQGATETGAPAALDRGRGSGRSSGAPSGTTARAVCYAAAELVRLVGRVESMKPVLQSLYHRILLYPPPRHRAEAIRVMKEIVGCPQRLLDLAGPGLAEPEGGRRAFSKRKSHLDLLRLVMDGMTEACAKGGAEACYWSVSCVCALLTALEELSQGRGLMPDQVALLEARAHELKESSDIDEADIPRRRRFPSSAEVPPRDPDVSVSISVSADGGDADSDSESASAEGEEEWMRRETRPAPPDVVQRSHALVYPDITNFLSVESRSRGAPTSRYSESNLSTEEQDLSRTELDSCDRYSAAAEKDSGRSDVSDAGSDEEDDASPSSLSPPCHQEADRRGARLFVRALAALLPQLLALDSAAQVDRHLQNFAHAFCSGGSSPPGAEAASSLSCHTLMNTDGVYFLSFSALLLNLKLRDCDFYQRGALSPSLGPKEFVRGIQTSGLLVVLSPAWMEEVHRQFLERDLLAQAGYWEAPERTAPPLVAVLTDMDVPGSGGAVGSQPTGTFRRSGSDNVVTAGAAFSRFLLTGVWSELTEVLSAPLGAAGCQSRRERDAVYLSLDGLRRAAALSRDLGVAANCASALARMAAASCAKEGPDEREGREAGPDAVRQVKQRPEQTSRPAVVCLRGAHVLCMDAILDVGLEMAAHHHQCWTHVFRVTEYISSLEHAHFGDGETRAEGRAPDPASTVRDLAGGGAEPKGGSLLSGASAARAVCVLSTRADRLLEDASLQRNLPSLLGFLQQLRKASRCQLFRSVADTGDYSLATPGEAKLTLGRPSALHLFRLGEATLRIVRDGNRPLLHKMRAWSVVAPHLVEAACHKERHVSRKAVSLIHDVLTEVLNGWSEPPGFRFNEALFRPFEHIMQLELCDDDVQDQVVTSIGELVEACSPRILSGWRPLFSALGNVRGAHAETKEYGAGERHAPVFDVFEAFVGTDDVQVFANATTDYIVCLVKFVKGLGEADGKEMDDCGLASGGSLDLCLPALDYLHRCSQLLASIYKMPSKPVFLGARLAGRHRSLADAGEEAWDAVVRDFDDGTGLIQVWILLLEQLAAAASDCPRRHQPPALETLFRLLREAAVVPGPAFAISAVTRLLLPVMSLWLRRVGTRPAYRDGAADFKHAIGLCCELAVEHVRNFVNADVGCEFLINAMLKELFRLLVSCVSQASETVSRVGCSCIRYALVTAGPVFTEEMWRLACCALRDAFSVTLQPVKKLLWCFQSGSDSFCGDACEVKMAAPSPSVEAEAEYRRIRAVARQVFASDGQLSPKTPNNKDGFEHAQSCVLIIEPPLDPRADTPPYESIPFRNVVVSLLSHQVLLQNLSDILLEELVEEPDGQRMATPATSRPPPAGFLPYLSASNLSIVLDLLLDSYRTARDFDTRPGLKYLLMKVSGVGGVANLYRQAAASFNLYARTLLGAVAAHADGLTAQQVKRIVSEDEDRSSDSSRPGSASSEDEDIFEETAQVSPPLGRERRQRWRAAVSSPTAAPAGGSASEWAWLVKRLRGLTADVCGGYVRLRGDSEDPAAVARPAFLPLFPSEASTPTSAGGDTPSDGAAAFGSPAELSQLRCLKWRGGRRTPPLRHSRSAEVFGSRSGSAVSLHGRVGDDDARAQIQAWSDMAATLLTEVLRLSDSAFTALQPALYPDLCQLACRVAEPRLRRALCDWLARVGTLYDIVA